MCVDAEGNFRPTRILKVTSMEFFLSLPVIAQVIIGFCVVGVIFALLKRLVKFALSLAALVILVLVISKLLNH